VSWALRVGILWGAALAMAALTAALPPIPQPLSYHDFADQRTLLGIPHFWNVLSNAAILLAGVRGLFFVARPWICAGAFHRTIERWPYLLFFAGAVLTAFGSVYYHLRPDHATLVWDRLPLTAMFMAFFAAMITERVGVRTGLLLLAPLILAGAASVWAWGLSEARGAGDLRWYGYAKFGPMVLILLLLILFPPRYSRAGDVLGAMGFYALATLAEWQDQGLFVGGLLSGHTLKHLLAGAGIYWIDRMLRRRHPVLQLPDRYTI
jgi:hypothetical protein